MKKFLLILLTGISFTTAQAQEISIVDAMRYAQDNMNGTARFRGMSGAFGALGGDLSAINVNPAGAAVFTDNQFGATVSNYNIKNKSSYFGTTESENDNSFDLSQAGAIFVFTNDNTESSWKKFTLSANYENINNFDNSIFTSGTNPTNSIDSYFLNYANQNGGINIDLVTLQPNESISDLYAYLGESYGTGAQQAFLGYQAYVINSDPGDPNGNSYITNVPSGNFFQENSMESTGYNGKLSFTAATQYKDRWFFGLSLNSHFTDYIQTSSFYESNDNDLTGGLQRLRFNNELRTTGNGFSFNLGIIAKIYGGLRAGASYESPTWYRLQDKTAQSISSVRADAGGELPAVRINPDIVNVYDSHRLRTPGKWTTSLAYVFGKRALISVDYALKDYSNTEFTPNMDFRDVNNSMSDELTSAGELRIGGEVRIKEWSIRGGYRNEQSPYKNGKTVGDLNGFSAGFGYDFGITRLDLAYSYAQRDYQQQFFTSGLLDVSSVKAKNNNVSVTVLFDL